MQDKSIRAVDGCRSAVAASLSAVLWAALVGTAGACPAERLLTVVVPYAAGGSVDVTTRILAKTVGHHLGRPVNVSNIPGASGLLAVRKVLGAERDGCTLLSGSANTVIVVPIMNPHAEFTAENLIPVGKVGITDMVLVASARSGLRDMHGLQRAAAASEPLRAGHPGQESLQAVALRQLGKRLKAPLIEVPYSGAAPLVNDLAGGHLDIAVLAKPVALPMIQRGALNLISTLHERDGYVLGSWSGWFAARGVPDAGLEPTAQAMARALSDISTRQSLMELGLSIDAAADWQAFAREVGVTAARLREQMGVPPLSASGASISR
jgi:tripartite-type tricarboxylate transporter receptor subunit TctC